MAAAIIKAQQDRAKKTEAVRSQLHENESPTKPDPMAAQPDWDPHRLRAHEIVNSHKFEAFCGGVILFNMFLVILETDASADGGNPERWLDIVAKMLLAFYTMELCVKGYIFRHNFFKEPWNVLDLVIVGVDLILLVMGFLVSNMPSVAILRVFRLAKLARAVKAAKQFQELNALIRSFGFAMKAIFWGILMIVMILTIWSILAVQLLHPINRRLVEENPLLYEGCSRCPEAFSSVFESALTFFQHVVAGDSWGNVSLPIIRAAPWTALFFLSVLVTVNLTMLNLILAVIVEAGAKATEEDMHEKAKEAQKRIRHAESRLIELCTTLDEDGSGSLNIDEFLNGFNNNAEFADCLQTMNVTQSDIHMIFNICDEDGSGDVNYLEFVEQLRRIRRQGEQMLLYYVTEIRHKVQQLKLKLVDQVQAKLTELADFGRGEDEGCNGVKMEAQFEGAPTSITDSALEGSEQKQEKHQAKDLAGQDSLRIMSGYPEPKAFNMFPPRSPAPAGSALLSTPEPKAPPPTSFREVLSEMVPIRPDVYGGDLMYGDSMSSSQQAVLLSPGGSRMLGCINNTQLDKLLQVNQDIALVMQDVVTQSKLHTGLLNTLAAEVPPPSSKTRQTPSAGSCCVPSRPPVQVV